MQDELLLFAGEELHLLELSLELRGRAGLAFGGVRLAAEQFGNRHFQSGRPLVEIDVSTTEYTAFDILGRVTAHKQTTDGQEYATGYVYDLSGALIEQTYPSGRKVKNLLDNNGDLSMVQSAKCLDSTPGTNAACTAQAGFWNYAKNFSYNSAGAVTGMQLGNGKWESTQFNSRLQPTQIALGTVQNGHDKLRLQYGYGDTDNNGNVVSQTITVPTVGTEQGFTATQNYAYDSLNRLKSAEETISSQTSWKQAFTFDRYGNRNFDEANTTFAGFEKLCNNNTELCAELRKILNPSVNTSNNRLSSSDDYVFDAAGNTTVDAQGRQFTYDAENHQIEVQDDEDNTLGEYFYDGDGKRVKKYVPGTGEVTVFVYDASGRSIAEYSTVVESVENAKVAYLTNDHLGSPRILTDGNGAVISRRDFLPFGEEINSGTGGRTTAQGYNTGGGQDSIRQKFTGYERDAETSLDYAKARMFGSSLGRFTSPDDFLNDTHVSDPQSWNLYIYVRNNPLRFIDPDGEVKRDANGNVITEERKDKDPYTKVIDGKTYYVAPFQINGKEVLSEAQKVWITADDGKKIKAHKITGEMQILETKTDEKGKKTESLMSVEKSKETIDKLGDSTTLPFSNKTNCHGTTFASGQVLIENDQVGALRKGDGFRSLGKSETAQKDDVGIYSDESSDYAHSVRVNSTNEKGVVDVVSKGGITRQVTTTPGKAWYNPAAKLQYFTQRPKPKN